MWFRGRRHGSPFAIIAMVVLSTTSVESAPLIGTVEVVDGTTLVISGSGFGMRSRNTPVLYDTIDNQPAYLAHDLAYGDEVPVVTDGDCPDCPWATRIPPSWGNSPKFFDVPDSLRVAGRPVYKVSRKGFFRGREPFADIDEHATVFMSWWVWSSHSLRNPPGNVETCKLIRYTAGSGSDTWQEQIEATTHLLYGTKNGCSADGWYHWGYYSLDAPRWNHIELEFTGGGNLAEGTGRAEYRVNGKLEVVAEQVYSCHGMLDHVFVWGADPSNPAVTYPPDSVILFGELYLDTTRARVILTDSATYQPNGLNEVHWEIQPTTSWQTNSIATELNRGTLATSDLYVYVIDPLGAVSAGFPISLDGVDSGPPGSPGVVDMDLDVD